MITIQSVKEENWNNLEKLRSIENKDYQIKDPGFQTLRSGKLNLFDQQSKMKNCFSI